MFVFESMPIADFARSPKGTVALYEVAPADVNKAQTRLVVYAKRAGSAVTSERIWGIAPSGATTRFIRAKVTKAARGKK
jgi:hypothetical protein